MGLILERATLAEIKLKLEAAVWLRLGAEGRGQSWRQCLYIYVCVFVCEKRIAGQGECKNCSWQQLRLWQLLLQQLSFIDFSAVCVCVNVIDLHASQMNEDTHRERHTHTHMSVYHCANDKLIGYAAIHRLPIGSRPFLQGGEEGE